MQKLQTRLTTWEAKDAQVTLNVCTEACIVPSDATSARLSYGHIVVLDEFFNEEVRKDIFEAVNCPDWREDWNRPPEPKWQRSTCDQADQPPSWGLQDVHLRELLRFPSPAMIEVQSRLCKLYPEVDIFHMPSEQIQSVPEPSEEERRTERHSSEDAGQRMSGETHTVDYDCDQFVANAAVYGDCFQWHVDADPWTFHENSRWAQQHGIYFNGEPGKPLFVSLLIYLNSEWEREWNAETLFLDSHTETGIFVRPQAFRAVLMDQDVMHRLSVPSEAARRPRYSLVWKLVFVPRQTNQHVQLSKREWGTPTYFGSAAKAKAVQEALF